jgi:hypothetical protein
MKRSLLWNCKTSRKRTSILILLASIGQIDDLLALDDEEKANATPALPETAVSRSGELWLLVPHRVLCGDATSTEAVARLLGERKPR